MNTLNQFAELFALDIRNIMSLLFWGNLALAALVFTFRSTVFDKNNKTQLLVFGCSKVFQTLAWLFFFTRSDSASLTSFNVLISNTLAFSCNYLESMAILMLIKNNSKKSYQTQTYYL